MQLWPLTVKGVGFQGRSPQRASFWDVLPYRSSPVLLTCASANGSLRTTIDAPAA